MPPLCRTKHNRAKPMFELPSAIFLIADGNEFRFARFYIVCEEVPLGTPESPPIVSGVSDMHPSVSKRGRDTESDAVIRLEEIHTFFSNECSRCSSIRNLYQVLFIILLIAKGAGHGKRQLHKIQLVYMTIQVVRWKRYR